MARYFLLLAMTPEGRERALADPDGLRRAEEASRIPGVHCLGLYGVIGAYDFVSIVEAPDNEAAARFSLEFGVTAGVHVTTLPAIPIGELEMRSPRAARAEAPPPSPDPR